MQNRNLILVVVVVVLLALGLVTYYFVTQRGLPVQLPGVSPTQPQPQEPSGPFPLPPAEIPEATPTIPTP